MEGAKLQTTTNARQGHDLGQVGRYMNSVQQKKENKLLYCNMKENQADHLPSTGWNMAHTHTGPQVLDISSKGI